MTIAVDLGRKATKPTNQLKLSIDFSGCEKQRLKLNKIKIVLIFLKITMLSLTANTTSIQASYLAFDIAC